jgi:hypothetical protein
MFAGRARFFGGTKGFPTPRQNSFRVRGGKYNGPYVFIAPVVTSEAAISQ